MDQLVREYLQEEYPTDELIDEIYEDLTFKDLFDRMCEGEDFYDIVGVGDSVVREYAFEALSNFLNCEYDDIYNLWLHGVIPQV